MNDNNKRLRELEEENASLKKQRIQNGENSKNKSMKELEEENARLRAKIQRLEKLHSEEELNSAKRVTYRYVPPTTSKPEKPKNVRIQTLTPIFKHTLTHANNRSIATP